MSRESSIRLQNTREQSDAQRPARNSCVTFVVSLSNASRGVESGTCRTGPAAAHNQPVEELTEDITNQNVHGMVIEEVQEMARDAAQVFYDHGRTLVWSKKQDERNTFKGPTKMRVFRESEPQRLIERDGS